jgi:hypothetical protein
MPEPITTWKESVGADEDATLAALAARLGELQRARGGGDRALHSKVHAGLRGLLHVREGLPPAAAQGVFATPGTRRCIVRFSNGSAGHKPDRTPDLRGLALKILEVDGPKELGDARTQDFLFIDNDTLPFRSPDEFLAFLESARNQLTLPFTLVGKLGFRALGLIGALAREVKGDRGSVLDLAYHTVGAVRFGPYAARLHLEPVHHASPHARPSADRDYLAKELGPRVRAGGVAFELSAQLCTETDSVEDVGARWTGPRVALGKLEIVADDPSSAEGERLASFVESLSFDPWHCLVAHRPLGLTMRARKPAYYESTRTRRAAPDPDASAWASFDA